jgi:hypothetical protein
MIILIECIPEWCALFDAADRDGTVRVRKESWASLLSPPPLMSRDIMPGGSDRIRCHRCIVQETRVLRQARHGFAVEGCYVIFSSKKSWMLYTFSAVFDDLRWN